MPLPLDTFTLGPLHLAARVVGSGPPLLLVHGFPLDHTMWRYQIEDLSARYRVIAPDLRGFGASGFDPRDETVTMRRYADDLAQLMDHLAPDEKFTFCGLSMGGYIAFQFWQAYRDRLAALVLCDTRAIADTPQAREGRKALSARVLSEGPAAAADAMMPKFFAPRTELDNKAVVEETRAAILRASPRGIAAALAGMAARPDVTAWLPEIATPTLVVVGQHDAISTADEMRGLADQIPGAQFVAIPAAGHMLPLEKPADFRRAIESFLQTVAPRGSAPC